MLCQDKFRLLVGVMLTGVLAIANVGMASNVKAICGKECGYLEEADRGVRSDPECTSSCKWVLCNWSTQECINEYGSGDNAYCNDHCFSFLECAPPI